MDHYKKSRKLMAKMPYFFECYHLNLPLTRLLLQGDRGFLAASTTKKNAAAFAATATKWQPPPERTTWGLPPLA
jgi:hypothetical protein